MSHPLYLNLISFFGIFGLCAIAWLFSENKRIIPWRVIIWGIGLQLVLAFLVFKFPPTRIALERFTTLLDAVFVAADTGARFVFGRNIVPIPGQDPPINLGYIFAFRALPTVIFFSGLMALLYNIGVIQVITELFAKLFYWTMRLSGAEALSGAANIFVGIEAAIVVKPYLPKMTRSELCAILACCFGTAASSTLAIYVSFLRPVFPNILGHLVSASIIAIPACFVISKILVPETGTPLTLGGIPSEKTAKEFEQNEFEEVEKEGTYKQETVAGEPIERVSPLDAAIVGSLDGVKMAVAIAAVLILILGLVSLVNQFFGWLGGLPGPVGNVFKVVTLANIQGVLFYPLTILTGVPFSESWEASVIIGRRLLETAIPPYQALAEAAQRPVHPLSDRTVLIVSYALSGFAHLASVGIFVGGTIALIPSRRKDISELGWKALFAGTLATIMIACLAGVFDTGDPSILGVQGDPASITAPAASPTVSPVPGATISPVPTSTPVNPAITPLPATTISPEPTSTPVSPALAPSPATRLQAPATKAPATKAPATPRAIVSPRANPTATPPATPRATSSPTQQAPQPKPTASAVPSPSR
jgi:CNT family concentrative nucleoside transporter